MGSLWNERIVLFSVLAISGTGWTKLFFFFLGGGGGGLEKSVFRSIMENFENFGRAW
jgi:hypothetical protein